MKRTKKIQRDIDFVRAKRKDKEATVIFYCNKCEYTAYYYGSATPSLICPTCGSDKKRATIIKRARERYLKSKEKK